ncbi:hypothetical protein [Methylocella tundrae]|uniref:Uncharacterized protein n=1 Tax=Methylocella tundrae TaxID=227605 RepID=A0A4U8Z4V1_METTU|nr:hypothetical protein [Methylocella tundrae]WPP04210.1 hypothetical protein SIN04_17420 [Methylocella tundrae]VFU10495.1 protein of unknown function [Methylocella tundrae]
MSVLSQILAFQPVDECIVGAIVEAVALPAVKIDCAALGADLAAAQWRSQRLQGKSSPRKQSPTQRKRRAETVRTHAAKLFNALGPAVEEAATRDELWRNLCGLQPDEDLPPSPLRVEALGQFLDILQLLALGSDRTLSAAGAEIQTVKVRKRMEDSNPAWARLVDLWSPPKTVTWIIAFDLAPVFEAHFKKKATASTPSQATEDRTPQGPFVRFVRAVQQHLKLFPDQESVSPHTVAEALAIRKHEADEQGRIDARLRPFLQGDSRKRI